MSTNFCDNTRISISTLVCIYNLQSIIIEIILNIYSSKVTTFTLEMDLFNLPEV